MPGERLGREVRLADARVQRTAQLFSEWVRPDGV